MGLSNLKIKFDKLYGKDNIDIFFSPSRVNLIGEHIDYNGGHVLPCALQLGTYGCVRKRSDNKVRLASENFDLKVEIEINNLKYEKAFGWANYPMGVIYFMKEKGYDVGGMDILVSGNIPNGAGLSSSASLELLIAEMINYIYNNGEIPKIELIKISQRAENEFVGVKCGIMDQFAVAMGKENSAILLDCDSLKYKYIDMNTNNYQIVIMNTNKRRELNESKYNERREECEKALSILNKYTKIDNLCQLKVEEFEELEKYIVEENIKNRTRHVVYENQRVLRASDYLESGNMEGLGQLFRESHYSLKELYEVTGLHLDTLVQAALNHNSCVGARMTGAGFGGCAIALVENDSIDDFIYEVGTTYNKKTGHKADFYITGIDNGVRKLTEVI